MTGHTAQAGLPRVRLPPQPPGWSQGCQPVYAVRSSDSLGSRFSAIGFSLLCDSDTGRVRGYQGQAEGEDRRQDHQLPYGLSPQARVLWRYVTGVVSQGRLILILGHRVRGTSLLLMYLS